MAIRIGDKTLYEALGGRPTLQRVHKIFYDKIYQHPWIGKYFESVKQEVIEEQQTDFMAEAMGGPSVYCGKLPIPAHKHMFVTEDLFQLRNRLLREALAEAEVPSELAEHWIKIDGAFKTAIVKKSMADCKKRFETDEIMNFPNPEEDGEKRVA